MLRKAASVIFILMMFMPIFASSIYAEKEWENKPASGFSKKLDTVTLEFDLEPSCEFGITTSSYALSAEHTDEIILNKIENNNTITSELADSNPAVFVYYRAVGDVDFNLYLSLEGDLKGTVKKNNQDTIRWHVKWTDDNKEQHTLTSSPTGDDGGEYNSQDRYLLSYNKPAKAIGGNGIQRIDNIEIEEISDGKTPDIYQGQMRITLVTT